MGLAHDVEILWNDLLDAFENPDPGLVYLLDRGTGEVFFVPSDYEDDAFWMEVAQHRDQYLRIPGFDYELERLLLHQFIREIPDEPLRQVLERTFTGRSPYGKVEDILTFYPDELDMYLALKEELITDRIRLWLEEHDIVPAGAAY